MRIRFIYKSLVLLNIFIFSGTFLEGFYKVRDKDGQIAPLSDVTVTSVMGEPRPVGNVNPNRFHRGVDIDLANGYDEGDNFYLIEEGTLLGFPGDDDNEHNNWHGIRIKANDLSGRILEYVHITPDTNVIKKGTIGSIIPITNPIGAVNSNHLHLNELRVNSITGEYHYVNPLGPFGLNFDEKGSAMFKGNTGAAVQMFGISIIKEKETSEEDGINNPLEAFQVIGNRFFIGGKVDIIASVNHGTSRKGVHSLSYFARRVSDGGTVKNGILNIAFNTMPDAIDNNTGEHYEKSGFNNIYSTRNADSFVMFVTNKMNNLTTNVFSQKQTEDSTWDTASQDGEIILDVTVLDRFGRGETVTLLVVVDNSPPTINSTIPSGAPRLAGGGSCIESNETTFTWDGDFSVDENGIAEFQAQVINSVTGAVFLDTVVPSDITSIFVNGLTQDNTYFMQVRARDLVGNNGPFLVGDGIRIGCPPDNTPPSTPIVIDDGPETFLSTRLQANWSSEDDESGIAFYEYAIGTVPGWADTVGFTNTGTNTSVTRTGLNLSNGTTYYFSVKATNRKGGVSGVGVSDGIVVHPIPVNAEELNWTVTASAIETYTQTFLTNTLQKSFQLSSSNGNKVTQEFNININQPPALIKFIEVIGPGNLVIEIFRDGFSEHTITQPLSSGSSLLCLPGFPSCDTTTFDVSNIGSRRLEMTWSGSEQATIEVNYQEGVFTDETITEPISSVAGDTDFLIPDGKISIPYSLTLQPQNGGTLSDIDATLSVDNSVLITTFTKIISGTNVSGNVIAILDTTPPEAPMDVRLDGADNLSFWKNSPDFNITWTNPDDVSGIAGAFIQESNFPEIFTTQTTQYTWTILAKDVLGNTIEGEHPLTIKLKDNVGFTGPPAHVSLRYETQPPESAVSSSVEITTITPLSLQFNALDQQFLSGISRVDLFYRYDANDDGDYGDSNIGDINWSDSGLIAFSSGLTPFSGEFIYFPQGSGTYEFRSRAFDIAGNEEPSKNFAEVSVFFDSTPAIISNTTFPVISPNVAELTWKSDDNTTSTVKYGTGTMFNFIVIDDSLSQDHSIFLTSLISPATINFEITSVNRVGFITKTTGSFATTPDLVIPLKQSVTRLGEPITFVTSNPDVSTVTFIINKGTPNEQIIVTTQVVVGMGFEIFPDTSSLISGEFNSIEVLVEGFEPIIQEFLVDTTRRENILCILVNTVTGGRSSDINTVLDFTVGDVTSEDMSNANQGGKSTIFLGLYSNIDPIPPGQITEIAGKSGPDIGQISLAWTAPGDDAYVGKAMSYDLRFSERQIVPNEDPNAGDPDKIRFSDAQRYIVDKSTDAFVPSLAGTYEQVIVDGLSNSTSYFFAVRAEDELSNFSTITYFGPRRTLDLAVSSSNINGVPIVQFKSSIPGVEIVVASMTSNSTTTLTVALATGTMVSQGFVPLSMIYDITTPDNAHEIPGGATIQFRYSDFGFDVEASSTFGIYEFRPDLSPPEWIFLADSTIFAADGDDYIEASVFGLSLFALLMADSKAPVTLLQTACPDDNQDPDYDCKYVNPQGSVYVTSSTHLMLQFKDPSVDQGGMVPGQGVSKTEYRIDTSTGPFQELVLSTSNLKDESAISIELTEGFHTVQFRSVDFSSNVEPTRSVAVRVDTTPSVSEFIIEGSSFIINQGICVSTRTSLMSKGNDPISKFVACGLKNIEFRIESATDSSLGFSTMSFSVSQSTFFKFPEGEYTIHYRAQDNLRNYEIQKSTTIFVDATPPTNNLTFDSRMVQNGELTFITTATFLTIASTEPVSNGVTSGIKELSISVDDSTFTLPVNISTLTAVSLPFNVTESSHVIRAIVSDQVSNVTTRYFTIENSTVGQGPRIIMDAKAPEPFLTVSESVYLIDGVTYVKSLNTCSVSADDMLIKSPIFESDFSVISSTDWTFFGNPGGSFVEGTLELASEDENGAAVALLNRQISHDRIVEVDMKTLSSNVSRDWNMGWIDIIRNSTSTERIFALIHSSGNIEMNIDNGQSKSIYNSPSRIDPFRNHVFRFVVSGNRVKLLVDGIQYLDVTDEKIGQIQGTVGFEANGLATARYDNLRIWEIVPGGVGGEKVEVSIDGSSFVESSGAIVFSGEGSHSLSYRAMDALDNDGGVKQVDFVIDDTPPLSTIELLPELSGGYALPGLETAITSADGGVIPSGVRLTEYKGSSGLWRHLILSTITFQYEGEYSLNVRATDKIDNMEAEKSVTFKIDGTAPQSTLTSDVPMLVSGGNTFISPFNKLSLTGADPPLQKSVFKDEFNTPKKDLRVLSGVWTLEDTGTPTVPNRAFTGDSGEAMLFGGWSDFTLESSVRTIQSGPNPWEVGGFYLRYQDENNHYWLLITSLQYLELIRVKDGQSVKLVEDAVSVNTTDNNRIRVTATGPRFEIYLNGNLVADVTDPNPEFIPKGDIGLRSFFSRASYDDVSVLSPENVILFEDSFDIYNNWAVEYGNWDTTGQGKVQGTNGRIKTMKDYPVDRIVHAKIQTVVPGTLETWHTGWIYPKFETLENSLGLFLHQSGNLEVSLRKDNIVTRWDVPTGLLPSDGHDFITETSSSHLKVTIDGQKYLDVFNSTVALIAGGVALQAEGSTALYDDIVITTATTIPGSEIGQLLYSLDGGPENVIASTFSVVEGGTHTIVYRSIDVAGNAEEPKSFEFIVDANSPIVSISSPTDGDVFIALKDTFTVLYDITDNYDTAPSSEAFLSHGVSTAVVAVGDGEDIDPASLMQGLWTLTVNTTDFVGNFSSGTVSFQVIHDTIAPVTTVESAGIQFKLLDTIFVSSQTQLALGTTDDLTVTGDKNGLGVVETQIAIGSSSFSLYNGSFTLVDEGAYLLNYFSRDVAGNSEEVRFTTVAVDNSAPVTSVSFNGPQSVLNGDVIISSNTGVDIQALDALSNGGASGIKEIAISIDSSSFTVSQSTSFVLSGGSHTISYRATDNLGYKDIDRSTAVVVDIGTPVISISSSPGGKVFTGTDIIDISFTVSDDLDPSPISNAFLVLCATCGLGETVQTVSVMNGESVNPQLLSAGQWRLQVNASDFVDNTSVLETELFEVVNDTIAPTTILNLAGPQFVSSGTVYITSQTALALRTTDDFLVDGDLKGLGSSMTLVSLDFSVFVLYSTSLTLTEGQHTVRFFSVDRIGNKESTQTVTLFVDNTAPLSTIALNKSLLNGYVTPGLDATVTASDDGINPVGVETLLYRQTGQLWRPVTSSTFNFLNEGEYLLESRASDHLGNQEEIKSISFRLDESSPSTTLTSDPPIFILNGQNYASPAHTFGLIGADPSLQAAVLESRFESPRGDWRELDGTWSIEKSSQAGANRGVYIGNNGKSFIDGDWKDIDFEGLVKTLEAGPGPGDVGNFLLRYRDSGNYYQLIFRQDGNLELNRVKDSVSVNISQTPVAFNVLEENKVLARMTGARFEIFVNDLLVLDVTDPDPEYITQGGIVLQSLLSRASYNDVKVTPLTPNDGPVFQDSFDAFGDWVVEYGDWETTAENKLQGSLGRIKTSASYPADRIVRAKIQTTLAGTQETWHTGWIFPKFETYENSIGLFLHQGGNLEVSLRKDNIVTRWDIPTGLDPTDQHEFEAETVGSRLKVAIDGQSFLDVVNSTVALISGSVALQSEMSTAFYDDIVVTTASIIPGSGIDQTLYALDGGVEGPFVSSFSFVSAGSHTITYRSRDKLGHEEDIKEFQLTIDNVPPVTELITQNLYTDGINNFANISQTYELTAQDMDVSEDVFLDDFSAGLSQWQVLFGSWSVINGAMRGSLHSGNKTIRDDFLIDRTVTMKVQTILAGSNSWETAWIYPKYVDSNNYVRAILHTTGWLEIDVVKDGVNDRSDIFTGLDPQNLHTFKAVISSGNIKVLYDDVQFADITKVNIGVLGGAVAVTGQASIIEVDDVEVKASLNTPSSGVKEIRAHVDSEPEFIYQSSITLDTEGAHTLFYHAEDNVGNLETTKSLNVFVDTTSPVSQPVYNGASVEVGTVTYVSTTTFVSVVSTDPVSQGNASGVKELLFSLDGSAFSLFTGTMSFLLDEGLHRIQFFSQDNVGNIEALQSLDIVSTSTLLSGSAPSTVTDLSAVLGITGELVLSWTAPGDDGTSGQAASYDIRYATYSSFDFDIASSVVSVSTPRVSGASEQMVVTGLSPLTTYYFALKSMDQEFNVSLISNISSATTLLVSASSITLGNNPEFVVVSSQTVTISAVPVVTGIGNIVLATTAVQGFVPISTIYDLGPDSAVFDPVATVTFRYSTTSLPIGSTEDDIKIYQYVSGLGLAEKIDIVIDKTNKLISAKMNQVNPDVPFGAPRIVPFSDPLVSRPPEDFVLREVYAFPNPSVGGQRPTIHIEVGIADSVDIRIYDVSGDLVHQTRLIGRPQIVGTQYAYEYTWNQPGIASGVYIYVVQARKNGEGDIRVIKKIALIK